MNFTPADFGEINPEAVPAAASTRILELAQRFPDYKSLTQITDFESFLLLDIEDRYHIYAAIGQTTLNASLAQHVLQGGRIRGTIIRDGKISQGIFMVDVLPDQQLAGHGIISYTLDAKQSYSKNKPLVLGIETYHPGSTVPHSPEFRGQGYGHRRYLAMNAAALLVCGLPLYSRERTPGLLSPDAIRRWEALVNVGLAERFVGIGSRGQRVDRYRFRA